MEIKDIDNQLEADSHTPEMTQRLDAVKQQIDQSGEVVPYDQFKAVAAPLLAKRIQDPEQQINYISRSIPGFGYNKDTNEVVTPIPMADLKNLSRGDKKTLNRYADQLRSLSWLDENGRERRSAEYDSSTQDFMANFEEDFTYFSKMSGIGALLKAFGPKFLNKQKDKRDLSDKAALAGSTYTMMHNRARHMNSSKNNRYIDQFGDNNIAPTWYKRQILEQSNVLVDTCLNYIADQVVAPGPLHDMVQGGMAAAQQSAHFKDNTQLQSKYLINNLVLRSIVPQLMMVNPKLANALMKAVNSSTSPACDRLRNLFA